MLRPSSAILFCLLTFTFAASAKADPLTFDSPASTGAVQFFNFNSQGFAFSSSAAFFHVKSGHFSNAVSHNGTSFLVVAPNATGALTVTKGGAAFSITSFDADTFTHIVGSTTIEVIGTRVGGGTISQTFITDTVGDGPGPNADFQTFSLAGFNDLVAVQFSSVGRVFALDNLCVTASTEPVPEPATLFLLGTGLSGLSAVARRRLRKKARSS